MFSKKCIHSRMSHHYRELHAESECHWNTISGVMRWRACGGDCNLTSEPWTSENIVLLTHSRNTSPLSIFKCAHLWSGGWKEGEELKPSQPFVSIPEAVRWGAFNYSTHRYHHLHSPRFRYLHLTTIGWQDNSTESHLMLVYWRMSLSNGKTRDFFFWFFSSAKSKLVFMFIRI